MDGKRSEGAGFSDAEKAAMKQRAEELKSTKGVKGAAKTAKEYQACLDAIEALPEADSARLIPPTPPEKEFD